MPKAMFIAASRLAIQHGQARFRARLLHQAEAFDQLAEGDGAMADRVFLERIHLAEGLVVAVGAEDRIVAEPARTARRPDQRAVDASFEQVLAAVGPGQAQHADEMRATVRVVAELAVDARHGDAEIAAGAGPPRRI